MLERVKRRGAVAVGAVSTVALILPLSTVSAGAASTSSSSSSSSSSPSSPGITSKTITVGQIDDLSQPVPGLFKAAQDGTQAYFNYINSLGGVNGRRLVLDTRDSNFNSATVSSEAKSIAGSDFAMVGGYSLLDGSEKSAIDSNKLPDVTYPLDLNLANDSLVYSPSPSTTNTTPTGAYQWAKKTFGSATNSIGVLYPNASASTIASENILDSAMQSQGLKITYKRAFAETESTFNADVLKMKNQGVKMYYDQELPGLYSANLTKESSLQGYKPVNIQGIASYVQNMGQSSGGTANGMYLVQQAALFEGEDAKSVPEVSLFDKWVQKVDPKVFSSIVPLPSLDGWASAMLFAQALKAAGSSPTRAGIMAQLDKVTSFNAGGLLPPGENPANNIPSKCFLFARLQNSKWTRTNPTPKTGFYCSGGLKPSHGWKPQTR